MSLLLGAATLRIEARFFSFLVLLFHLLSFVSPESMEDCLLRADECLKDPKNLARGPVCGTDNHTYRNLCSLLHAQCQTRSISKLSDGQCNDPQPCLESLKYAQSLRNAGVHGMFMPRCRSDGLYAAVQCQEAVIDAGRYCWCVTPQGLPVPDSTVRTGRPHCGQKRRQGKQRTSRRYSRGGSGRKAKQGCKLADKRMFNANLIKIFKSEWTREINKRPEQRSESEFDRIVLDWKFSQLDKDNNDILKLSEYVDLKKIIKKNVKPKRCAKQFARTCDMNRDQDISRQEWVDCLARGAIDDSNSRVFPNLDSSISLDDDLEEDEDQEDLKPNLPRPGVLQISAPTLGTFSNLSDDNDDFPPESDCMYDRRLGLNDQQSNALFVPECTPDGRFNKVQCYSDYCWCVHENTGRNIPGTWIKDAIPKCDSAKAASTPMKGCPENRKAQFLTDLINFFSNKMSSNDFLGPGSRLEKTAMWSFNYLDQNRNKILERKEWKLFRSMVSPIQNLRHCGKKLPRYCDVNKDKKITVLEWKNCTGIYSKSKSLFGRNNPLETILKSD